MAIYKANISQEFTVIPNSTIQDKVLTFEARGLLSFMLSLPENWGFHTKWLQEQSPKCGRDKLTRMLTELQGANYVRKQVVRNDKGLITGTDWLVYPTPVIQDSSEQLKTSTVQLETRPTDKPSDGEPATIKETDLQNKHLKDITPENNSGLPSKTKRAKKTKADPLAKFDFSNWPSMPSDLVMQDWIAVRKARRSPLNQTAINRITPHLKKAVEAGYSVEDCIGTSAARGWVTFEFSWLLNANIRPSARPVQAPQADDDWTSQVFDPNDPLF
ncbi:hypothetical protein [Shewanella surugensis]|uniref:Helix-turn-helix domain-containing protein n=1 Tax=Shewanella surugensis TaxID=212020 RepID=A0ABT0L8W0_9GAMM|nr:hypothetical protein [Shewanella surugensis]MCL1124132.1 hypothetical protein [Shewanella surugensis]